LFVLVRSRLPVLTREIHEALLLLLLLLTAPSAGINGGRDHSYCFGLGPSLLRVSIDSYCLVFWHSVHNAPRIRWTFGVRKHSSDLDASHSEFQPSQMAGLISEVLNWPYVQGVLSGVGGNLSTAALSRMIHGLIDGVQRVWHRMVCGVALWRCCGLRT
jgi:hypothetical protein